MYTMLSAITLKVWIEDSWQSNFQCDDAYEPDGGGGGGARQEEESHSYRHQVHTQSYKSSLAEKHVS